MMKYIHKPFNIQDSSITTKIGGAQIFGGILNFCLTRRFVDNRHIKKHLDKIDIIYQGLQ